jgi:hypothetical protein
MPYIENRSYELCKLALNKSSRNVNNYYEFKEHNNFDKSKILEIQNILLNAYVFSHDKLDKALEDSASINDFNTLRKHVLAVRTHLRYISKYIIENEKNKAEIKKDL